MMMFTILFSWKRHLNITSFPGPIVAVLVMMLGEIEYLDLQYPQDLRIPNLTNGKIEEEPVFPQFPITAHIALLLFILGFCLVSMNLLVGVAVSDINKLMKTSKIDQLMDRVEHAGSVLNFRKMTTFKYLPKRFQERFRRMLDGCPRCGKGCECYWVQVKYLDNNDVSLPRSYKKLLHDFCIKQEREKLGRQKEKENQEMR